MKDIFRSTEIPVISRPNSPRRRNMNRHPAITLGDCTPFQLLERTCITYNGTICIIGNRGLEITRALTRRNQKPFLFLGTSADSHSAFSELGADWVLDEAQQSLPHGGNGAIYFTKPARSYSDIVAYIDDWAQEYFIIMHLGALKIGGELMNSLSGTDQSLLLCESLPQSILNDEIRTLTPLEFMKQIPYLIVFNSGSESRDLTQLLPTYTYEKITNSTGVNTFGSRSVFHPLHRHRGIGVNTSQSTTLLFDKKMFEQDDLRRLFASGYTLVYNQQQNTVYVAKLN